MLINLWRKRNFQWSESAINLCLQASFVVMSVAIWKRRNCLWLGTPPGRQLVVRDSGLRRCEPEDCWLQAIDAIGQRSSAGNDAQSIFARFHHCQLSLWISWWCDGSTTMLAVQIETSLSQEWSWNMLTLFQKGYALYVCTICIYRRRRSSTDFVGVVIITSTYFQVKRCCPSHGRAKPLDASQKKTKTSHYIPMLCNLL